MKTVLVFPSSLEASLVHLEDAKRWKLRVVGASSLEKDPYKDRFDDWEYLPFIHEKNFVDDLQKIIDRHNITAISIPHAPSYQRIAELKEFFPDVELLGESPYQKQMSRVTQAHELAKTSLIKIAALTDNAHLLSKNFLAAFLARVLPLYGESSYEKIIAICAIFCDMPRGDSVEIGSFFGKSAYLLNRLAYHFKTGAVLAVDPWNMEMSVQTESPQGIQKLSNVWDWELVFQGFLLANQATHAGAFNYLRMPSIEAWENYKHHKTISSPEFGETEYAGKIAVLHLDGNHDEPVVEEDFRLWSQAIMPGGWIIFDDYEWSQGDGPRKVTERVRTEWAGRIEKFFVAGGAAFIKLGDK